EDEGRLGWWWASHIWDVAWVGWLRARFWGMVSVTLESRLGRGPNVREYARLVCGWPMELGGARLGGVGKKRASTF
ncbi:hypothetical protein PIB30_097412, partial [Stylosanthes scabra]|nr:hypothetical protein [Stylosanthes scabra]